ncbi:MAG: hypothetical protein IKF72_10480 [Kiritimatiellae bacterium]|nr:hypothetical protein [Kiritimatiellia bacterium]
MPSFDIIAAIKLIWALVRNGTKVRVLKDFAAPNDKACPYLSVENTSGRTIGIRDFGLQLSSGHRLSINDAILLPGRNAFIELPKDVQPGTILTRYIPSSAIDLWYENDVYVVFTDGSTRTYHTRAMNLNPPAAR